MTRKIHCADLQYLTIEFAKNMALDKKDRVVFFDSKKRPNKSAQRRPLFIYSVVQPAYGAGFRMICDATNPLPISDFLLLAWSESVGLGIPGRLEVKSRLFSADGGYVEWAKHQGVVVSRALFDKSVARFGRRSQGIDFFRPSFGSDLQIDGLSLAQANDAIARSERLRVTDSGFSSAELAGLYSWRELERRYLPACAHERTHVPMVLDWNISSVTPLVDARPRAELVLRVADAYDPIPAADLVPSMWPSGRAAFFKRIGCRAFDYSHWVDGRADLPAPAAAEALSVLNISDGRMDGGQLLCSSTVKAFRIFYDELSCSCWGDVEYSFEIVDPLGSPADCRILFFKATSRDPVLVVFEDAAVAKAALESRRHICSDGAYPASEAVWEAVKRIIDNRRNFDKPERVAAVFAEDGIISSWLTARKNEMALLPRRSAAGSK